MQKRYHNSYLYIIVSVFPIRVKDERNYLNKKKLLWNDSVHRCVLKRARNELKEGESQQVIGREYQILGTETLWYRKFVVRKENHIYIVEGKISPVQACSSLLMEPSSVSGITYKLLILTQLQQYHTEVTQILIIITRTVKTSAFPIIFTSAQKDGNNNREILASIIDWSIPGDLRMCGL